MESSLITDVVLDLDETLIRSVPASDAAAVEALRRHHPYAVMDDAGLFVFFRPGVLRFLNELCELTNVSVWTAASQSYGLFVVSRLFDGDRRKCRAFFHREHCDRSLAETGHLKSLSWLSSKGAPELYPDPRHLVLVDDREEIKEANPGRAIVVEEFSGAARDEALGGVLYALRPSVVRELPGMTGGSPRKRSRTARPIF